MAALANLVAIPPAPARQLPEGGQSVKAVHKSLLTGCSNSCTAKVPEPVISRTRLLQVIIARFDKLELVLAGGALARGHQSIPQALARQDPAHDRQRAVNLQGVPE